MNIEEYKKLYKFEQFYWWHVGRRDILNSLLKKFLKTKDNKILEIGCGTGGNFNVLNKWGKIVGLDFSKQALKFCQNRGFDVLLLSGAEKISLPDKSFDLVIVLDVLEHIKDDKKAVKESWRVLKPGGYFLATVPAYQFLWSEHDKVLNHYRRYSYKDFLNKVKGAGFDIIKISYLISFVFPIVLVYRTLRKIMSPRSKKNTAYVSLPKFINNFFIFLLRFEGFLLKYFNFPFGTSIVCIAKKKDYEDL